MSECSLTPSQQRSRVQTELIGFALVFTFILLASGGLFFVFNSQADTFGDEVEEISVNMFIGDINEFVTNAYTFERETIRQTRAPQGDIVYGFQNDTTAEPQLSIRDLQGGTISSTVNISTQPLSYELPSGAEYTYVAGIWGRTDGTQQTVLYDKTRVLSLAESVSQSQTTLLLPELRTPGGDGRTVSRERSGRVSLGARDGSLKTREQMSLGTASNDAIEITVSGEHQRLLGQYIESLDQYDTLDVVQPPDTTNVYEIRRSSGGSLEQIEVIVPSIDLIVA